MDNEALIKDIINCAYKVRTKLLPGYLEGVYENALMIELDKAGIMAKQQCPMQVLYDGEKVGDYIADILVENCIIVEVKAVRSLEMAHEAQLVNYLTATNCENGLLINFGSPVKIEIRRKYKTYKPPVTAK